MLQVQAELCLVDLIII